ncbi:MAG: hypothetical protein EKK48_18965 [Candidatus Melainabacteria bacterium]|nr:MAG: hypothetical protein EKK48_18965 [Candidatus Melainabacteria bacterium]
MSKYKTPLWTNFHHVDRVAYANIQLEITLVCFAITIYFGSGEVVPALFLLTWAVDSLSRIRRLYCDVNETPKMSDYDRFIDLVRRMLWCSFIVSLATSTGGVLFGLAVLLTQSAIIRWAPKEIQVLRGVITIWEFH